jgi:divalent anion:Na+ symporter, DASS family
VQKEQINIKNDVKNSKKNSKLIRGLVVLAVGATIWFMPLPVGVKPQAWHLLAIFVAVILGFIIKPVTNGVMGLLGVTFAALTGVLTPAQALAGFGNTTVWTVVSAFLLATAFIKTGLGRRIAYKIIYAIGDKTLKLIYAILLTDFIIAPGMSSMAARVGGVLYPIVRSLCTAFGSEPGPTARKIGSFLMLTTHHAEANTSSTFMTASSANLLTVALAASAFGIQISWATWTLGAIVPGVIALLVVPYYLYKAYPPEIQETPEAKQIARVELHRLGNLNVKEKSLIVCFLSMLALWATYQFTQIDTAVVALLGGCALLVTGAIEWKDVLEEKPAWDTLVWMGAIMSLADGLNKLGIIAWFAKAVGASVAGVAWPVALAILVLSYFYAHYGFASIAAHVTALFTGFAVVAIAIGIPPFLGVLMLCYATHLSQSLTHYADGAAPIYFGSGYVDQGVWWKYGFIVSLINIAIWAGIGIPWWKLLGLW